MELDLQEVQGVHAEDRDGPCADACCCMVLPKVRIKEVRKIRILTKAAVGKKLGGSFVGDEEEASGIERVEARNSLG